MVMSSAVDIPAFASHQLNLLSRELDAEAAETRLLTSSFPPTVLQRAGLAILNLTVSSQRTGFGGKTLLELSLDPAIGSGELPEHGLRVGDIVSLSEQPKGAEKKKEREGLEKRGVNGVIVKVQSEHTVVALDKDEAEVPSGVGRLWLYVYQRPGDVSREDSRIDRLIRYSQNVKRVKLANEITFKRLNQTMTRLQKMQPSEHSILTQVLFGQSSPTPISTTDIDELKKGVVWNDPSLNPSQKEAIYFALASREIALIHGPPGTGKTHTLIELILQLLARKQRVLVCGPSNISVDNIVERLAPQKIPMVRLGHPARLLPGVLNHSLEVLTRTSEAAAIVKDVRTEMDSKQASIRKTRSGRERKAIYTELKALRQEYRQREGKVIGDLLRSSKVVLSTLHGAGSYNLKAQTFDVVIVDEASQALEAQCWIPVLNSSASKLVLAGDHLQLPPTIKSLNVKDSSVRTAKKSSKVSATAGVKDAKDLESKTKALDISNRSSWSSNATLETTLFDRLLVLHGESIKRMLTTQYRMHERIMAFPSHTLYDNKLIAAEGVKSRLLSELKYNDTGKVEVTEDTNEPVIFYDTQGGDFPEMVEDDSTSTGDDATRSIKASQLLADSKINAHEAAIVNSHVGKLAAAGVKAEDIAIVTPYNGQLALLASILKDKYPGIELGSVDGFQGREKEAIVVSLVRSNQQHEVGFLAEKRRLNVAMTRPKRQLCVVGDAETIGRGSNFLHQWMAWLEENSDLRYPDLAEVQQEMEGGIR